MGGQVETKPDWIKLRDVDRWMHWIRRSDILRVSDCGSNVMEVALREGGECIRANGDAKKFYERYFVTFSALELVHRGLQEPVSDNATEVDAA